MDWETLGIGALGSLIASAVFLVLLTWLRPKLHIAEKIANPQGESPSIKIVNGSRWRAVDVQVELLRRSVVQGAGGQHTKHEHLTGYLKEDSHFVLPGFRRGDSEASYALQHFLEEPIEEIWPDGTTQYLEFWVRATHPISGLGKLFVRTYRDKQSSVGHGKYAHGRSTEIV